MNPISASLSQLALPKEIAVPDLSFDEECGIDRVSLSSRAWPESPHPYRSAFLRDTGRILHAKAFRRMAGKTQVFTRRSSESDHSRSRLTHTLEVAQIARTATSALSLNAALAEALALVHDIGHPPFGHAGEKALDRMLRPYGLNFDHNIHALRIVAGFEDRYAAFRGLNLTLGVREGILKHSHDYKASEHPELQEYFPEIFRPHAIPENLANAFANTFIDQFPPLEAQLIDLADEIAYLTADIEDGLAARILEIPPLLEQVPLFARFYAQALSEFPHAETHLIANEALKQMLNALVTDLMQETARQVGLSQARNLADIRSAPHRLVQQSTPMEAERRQAKDFLYANLYLSPALEAEHSHAEQVIETLFSAWVTDPRLLPPDHLARVETQGAPRAVADYIAGMTDSYIEQAWLRHVRH